MKDLPIADMRGVTFDRVADVYSRRVGDLCERCGIYETCEGSSARANELDVEIVVSECGNFQPIILFVNPKGTDDVFSTIRLGQAWIKRLRTGSVVSLFSKKEGRYGTAEVIQTNLDIKSATICRSIYSNHMMLDFIGTQHDKIEALTKIVKNSYGNLIWKNNDMAVMISMKRIE